MGNEEDLLGHEGRVIRQENLQKDRCFIRFSGPDILLPGDIVLSIDGYNVGTDGTVEYREGDRISFQYCFDRKQLNERVTVKLLRDGDVISNTLVLDTPKESARYLVPRLLWETRPTYYILGGLVFSPLTLDYATLWEEIPSNLMAPAMLGMMMPKSPEKEDLVTLIDVLSDEINVGYEGFTDHIVTSVNGQKVASMRDFVAAIEQHTGDYHRIILGPYDNEIVLSRSWIMERNQIILDNYEIPADRSEDLAATVSGR